MFLLNLFYRNTYLTTPTSTSTSSNSISSFESSPQGDLSPLPSELILRILSFLDLRSLCNCSLINHYFQSLFQQGWLWRVFCHDLFIYRSKRKIDWTKDELLIGQNELNYWGVDSYKELYQLMISIEPFLGFWRTESSSRGGVIYFSNIKSQISIWTVYGPPNRKIFKPKEFLKFLSRRKVSIPISSSHIIEYDCLFDDSISSTQIRSTIEKNIFEFYRFNLPLNSLPAYNLGITPKKKQVGLEELQGLWCGIYGSHGPELLMTVLESNTLNSYKLIGDSNVPAGQKSFYANIKVTNEKWSGAGQIAGPGHFLPRWIPGGLTVENENRFHFSWGSNVNYSITFKRYFEHEGNLLL